MNLLLIRPHEWPASDHRLTLSDYRARHVIDVLKLRVGDSLTVGLANDKLGRASILAMDAHTVTLGDWALTHDSPESLALEVILALPRPRMLQRSLQTMATLGVRKIHLIHTERVEKSFWQTPLLKPAAIEHELILGVEQARATQIPEYALHPHWRTFYHAVLPALRAQHKVIAHPGPYPEAARLDLDKHPKHANATQALLAIGPEGGFTAAEVQDFIAQGFQPVQLGERILRVETAVPVLIATLLARH